jgi:hypothetical protein
MSSAAEMLENLTKEALAKEGKENQASETEAKTDASTNTTNPEQSQHPSEEDVIRSKLKTPAEQEAYQKGWRPPEYFKGNPADFVGAEAFLERGKIWRETKGLETQRLTLEERLKELETARQDFERQKQEFFKQNPANNKLEQLVELLTTERMERKRGEMEGRLKDLWEKKIEAYSTNNLEDAKRYEEEYYKYKPELDKLNDSAPYDAPERSQQRRTFSDKDQLEEFALTNKDWFNSKSVENEKMQAYAIYHLDKLEKNPTTTAWSMSRKLQEVNLAVKEAYADYFNNKNQDRPATVTPNMRKTEKRRITYSDVPEKYQKTIDEYISKGNLKITRDEYAQQLQEMGEIDYE